MAYNERRWAQAAAAALGVSYLRDVDLHALRGALEANAIDQLTYQARHVVAAYCCTEAAAAACRAATQRHWVD